MSQLNGDPSTQGMHLLAMLAQDRDYTVSITESRLAPSELHIDSHHPLQRVSAIRSTVPSVQNGTLLKFPDPKDYMNRHRWTDKLPPELAWPTALITPTVPRDYRDENAEEPRGPRPAERTSGRRNHAEAAPQRPDQIPGVEYFPPIPFRHYYPEDNTFKPPENLQSRASDDFRQHGEAREHGETSKHRKTREPREPRKSCEPHDPHQSGEPGEIREPREIREHRSAPYHLPDVYDPHDGRNWRNDPHGPRDGRYPEHRELPRSPRMDDRDLRYVHQPYPYTNRYDNRDQGWAGYHDYNGYAPRLNGNFEGYPDYHDGHDGEPRRRRGPDDRCYRENRPRGESSRRRSRSRSATRHRR